MKTVFTTGEAAKICKVSQQHIIRCFDRGQLKGYRVPGSKFRRIPRDKLFKFMKDNGIPTDTLEKPTYKVMLVGVDDVLRGPIEKQLTVGDGFEVKVEPSCFGAGFALQEFTAHVIIFECGLGETQIAGIVARLRESEDFAEVLLIALVQDEPPDALTKLGFHFVEKPFDPKLLKAKLLTAKETLFA